MVLTGRLRIEDVYLRAYESLAEARRGLAAYFAMFNTRRPHQSLDYRTPDAVYFAAPAAA